jgi:hypothetical protein
MNCRICLPLIGVAAIAASLAFVQAPAKDSKSPAPAKPAAAPTGTHDHATPGAQPELPPGMSQADMMACMEAATPGEMHAWLNEAVGVWQGKTTMWMTPGAEPMHSECVSTITSKMDGRFTTCETVGEMPGMGPFTGFGIYGFDNVSQQFQSTWVDNCGTGMMVGTGTLSSDGKTLTWNFNYNCPITKKLTPMREVERRTSKDAFTLEMFMNDLASGKEFKMMQIDFTRKPGATAGATSTR